MATFVELLVCLGLPYVRVVLYKCVILYQSLTSLPAFGLQSAVQLIAAYFKNIDH
jgi:hypothetical protein